MPAGGPSSNGVELEERKLRLEERKFENEEKRRQEEVQEKRKFDRNERSYRLLELKEKRAERLQVNSLREQENKLKEKEIELNRGRGIHLSPTQGTVAVAIFGLISAILGAAISGWYSRSIETEKNDTSYKVELEKKMRPFDLSVRNLRTLILKATEVPKREDQIKNLKFFLDAGFIRDPDKKIEKISEDSYPSSTPQNTPGATSGLLGFPSFRLLKYDLPELLSRVQDSIVLVTLTGLDKESKAVKLTTTGTVINKDGDILIASRGINEITSNLDIKVALRSEGSFVLEKKSESKPALLVKTEDEISLVKIDKYDPTNWIFGSGSNWIFGSGSISLASSKSSSDDRVTVLELKPNTSSDQFSPNGTDVWGQFASVGGQFATVLQRNPQEILIKEDLTDSPIGSPIFDSNGELLAIVVGKNKTTYYFNFILPGGAMRAKLVYSLPSIIAAVGSVMK